MRLRSAVFAAGLALGLSACASEPEGPPPLDVEVGDVDVYYLHADSTRSLRFEMALTNRTAEPLRLYAFAYAANDEADPPARAVYPPKALRSMPPNRRFALATPTSGLEKAMAPGERVPFAGALVVPRRWHDGRPIEAEVFTRLWLYLYNTEGRRVFEKSWSLVP